MGKENIQNIVEQRRLDESKGFLQLPMDTF